MSKSNVLIAVLKTSVAHIQFVRTGTTAMNYDHVLVKLFYGERPSCVRDICGLYIDSAVLPVHRCASVMQKFAVVREQYAIHYDVSLHPEKQ